MYKKLYAPFQHWQSNGTLYFYSDPHFSDEFMNKWRAITDEEQVRSINSIVGKNDTIVFLGDIGNIEWIPKIRGHKILLLGNHDRGKSYYEPYFEEIYEGILTISSNIVLSHEPFILQGAHEPFSLTGPKNRQFMFLIHGHDHANWFSSPYHLNCCAEHLNFKPISIDSIIKSGKLSGLESIHSQAVNNQKESSEKEWTI